MKKILQLVIFLFPAMLFAQIENYEIGQYFDYNNNLIDGYFDFDYEPKISLKKEVLLGEKFTPGYYFDLLNNRVDGYLRISFRNGVIRLAFRPKESKKKKRIDPEICKGFVLGKDSFITITTFYEQNTTENSKFVEVISETEEFTLLKSYRQVFRGNGLEEEFIVKNQATGDLENFPHKKSRFLNKAFYVFEGIDSNDYKYKDIPKIFKVYDLKNRYKNNEKIWFDSSWDEVNKGKNYSYYAEIVSFKDDLFNLMFYFKNGIPIYSGTFSSFYPQTKNGEFIWYYPDGNIRKKTVYKENESVGNTITFFKNGKIHYVYDKNYLYSGVYDFSGKKILDDKGNGKEFIYDSILKREKMPG
ncbi:MAG: hypothetical protein HC906_04730 [Bacteroidales bacterium]|nr:hypothetical protein [Bacteroidales bacterium]